MKKLMFAAAVAAGLVAFGEGIESANTVGYNTTSVAADSWYMIATQFKGIGQVTDVIPVNQLCTVKGIDATTFSTRNDGAQIQVYNGVGYTIYYYISDARNATGPCWTSSNRALADTVTIPLGTAFWLKTPATVGADASITVAGEVKTDATTVTTPVGASEWTQVANPFPTDLTLGMITTTGLTAQPFANRNSGAQIQVYNGVGYTIYYYISDARNATGPCWTTSNRAAADTTVVATAGQGFWVKSSEAGSLTFTLQ